MKLKIFTAAFLSAFVVAAAAQSSVTATYAVQEAVPSGVQYHVTNLQVKTALTQSFAVDVGTNTTTADVANSITNRYEAGLTASYPVFGVNADVRTAIGYKAKSGVSQIGYYSIEPGVNFVLPVNLTARIAYRYRNAFEQSNLDESNTTRVSLGYQLTKQDKVTVGYDKMTGDGANNQTRISWNRSF